jgi:polyketide biosynthesis enoyl-CoA hydratase PksI
MAPPELEVVVTDGVAVVQLVDESGRNELDEHLVDALVRGLDVVGRNPAVKALVFVGSPEVFCSGAPRSLLERLVRGEVVPTDIRLAKAVLDVPIPTIAAMEGHAVGGGLALGLCADIVLMSRESRYGASFINMGFSPGMGMTRLLEHVLSPAMAHEMLFTGELRRGADFEGKSGINYVLPRPEVRIRAIHLAQRIAEKSRVALELLKRTLSVRRRQAFEESYTLEAMMHAITFAQPETRSAIEDHYVD